MKIESHAEVLIEEAVTAFWQATDDVLAEAQRRAGQHRRTGKFQRSLEATQPEVTGEALRSRVGSPLSSARVKELGGFMQARHGQGRMRFALESGRWVALQAFRVAARPVVVPAGRLFPDFYRARLAALRGSAAGGPALSGGLVQPGKADVRQGPVTL